MKSKFNLSVLSICLTCFFVFSFSGTIMAQKRPVSKPTPTPKPTQLPSMPKPTLPTVDMLTIIRRKNSLAVGISTFMPWAMHDKNGKLIGFEVEVAKKLADDLGVELKLVPVGFSEIIGDLVNNRFDIIVTGIYPTPQRALFVNFSNPYSESKVELIANRDKMKNKDNLKDYNKSDVTIGIVNGTVYGNYIKEDFPMAKTQVFEQESELFQALADGKIEAGIASTPAPEFAMKLHKDKFFRPFSDPLGKLGESFAIRRGDTDFLNYLNTWIRYYNQTGWLKTERKKWFESDSWLNQL